MRSDNMLKITRKVSNHNIDSGKVIELVNYAKGLNVRIAEFDKKQGIPSGIAKACFPKNQAVASVVKIGCPHKPGFAAAAICPNEKGTVVSVEKKEAAAVKGIAVR